VYNFWGESKGDGDRKGLPRGWQKDESNTLNFIRPASANYERAFGAQPEVGTQKKPRRRSLIDLMGGSF